MLPSPVQIVKHEQRLQKGVVHFYFNDLGPELTTSEQEQIARRVAMQLGMRLRRPAIKWSG